MQRLNAQLEAGKIKRYHTKPIIGEQTVGEHSYGVAQIVRYLTNGLASTELLEAALDHDVAELHTGDVPFTVKRSNPNIKRAIRKAEKGIEQSLGLAHHLTEQEAQVLKWADLLEMGFFGMYQHELGNTGGLDIVDAVLTALRPCTSGRAYTLACELEDYLNECQ